MADKPDFEALRAGRNAAVQKMIEEIAVKMGATPANPVCSSFDPTACYCACPAGPCEHDFQGWRDIEDSHGCVSGGETVCSRCGMGAMTHSIRTAE